MKANKKTTTTKTAKKESNLKKEFADKLKDKLIKDGLPADFIKNKVVFVF